MWDWWRCGVEFWCLVCVHLLRPRGWYWEIFVQVQVRTDEDVQRGTRGGG